jgi:hypothetical protein
MGLVVAGLVAQLGNSGTDGRVLEVLTQIGAAQPAACKQAVGCLPPAQALLLHSSIRSASVVSGPGRLAGAKAAAPRLDFSRYC